MNPHAQHLVGRVFVEGVRSERELGWRSELLPPITPYFVMKVGRVPHIPYRRPGADEAAEADTT